MEISGSDFLDKTVEEIIKFIRQKHNLNTILPIQLVWKGKILKPKDSTLRELGVKPSDKLTVMTTQVAPSDK